MSYVGRLNTMRSVPLYRSSFALMLTTGLNGVLGFAYWVLAARLYPAVSAFPQGNSPKRRSSFHRTSRSESSRD